MKTKTVLPAFNGFYGSMFEDNDSSGEFDYINELRSENGLEPLENDNEFEFDYHTYFLELSNQLTNTVEEYLIDLKIVRSIKFDRLVSPKYYNYSNDKIYCTIDLCKKEFKKYLFENEVELSNYLHDNCSSYDGFISFYSNSLENWKKGTNNFVTLNETEVNILLNFILENEKFDIIDQLYNIGMRDIPFLSVQNTDYLLTL